MPTNRCKPTLALGWLAQMLFKISKRALQCTGIWMYITKTYGSDGKPIRDVDTGHPDHHPGVGSPHVHEWPDGRRSKKPYALPPSPESSQEESETNHEIDWGH